MNMNSQLLIHLVFLFRVCGDVDVVMIIPIQWHMLEIVSIFFEIVWINSIFFRCFAF